MAKKYGVSVADVMKGAGITDPKKLIAGRTITVTNSGGSVSKTKQSKSTVTNTDKSQSSRKNGWSQPLPPPEPPKKPDGDKSKKLLDGTIKTAGAIKAAEEIKDSAPEVINEAEKTIENVAEKVVSESSKIVNDVSEAVLNKLTPAQRASINKLENTIRDHLKKTDFSGTLCDLKGEPILDDKTGEPFQHLYEMKCSFATLDKVKISLGNSLNNPNLDIEVKSLLTDELNKATLYIGRIKELFKPYGGIE